MVDIVIFGTMAALFAGGFWCGKTFGSMQAMLNKIFEDTDI